MTFFEGPGGEHQMDVCGEGGNITHAKMLELAKQGGLDMAWAENVIARITEQTRQFRQLALTRNIRHVIIKLIESAVEANVTCSLFFKLLDIV
ncbi:MAG: serine/threonine-protein kinase HipA [Desulforhopalus sp.]